MTAMVVMNEGTFLISTDRSKLDIDVIHRFLTRSYWAEGIPRETVARSIENSLCFGIYNGGDQVGFARVVSDYATYAYIADVFILEPYRGRGLAKELMASVMAHPKLQGLRRWSLGPGNHSESFHHWRSQSFRQSPCGKWGRGSWFTGKPRASRAYSQQSAAPRRLSRCAISRAVDDSDRDRAPCHPCS